MKEAEFQFQDLGYYELVSNNDEQTKQMKITIIKELKDALINLGLFSHCVLFTKDNTGIYCYILKIAQINTATGEIIIEADEELKTIKGKLADIKPFFPCEELAEGYVFREEQDKEAFTQFFYKGNPIGKYIFANNYGTIKFQESDSLSADEITDTLNKIKANDFLRIIWWFDRFDDKRYRSHVMCKPPYENAPRCGVFATRSPVRPNPLASTVVKVMSVDPYNYSISILGFDGFEQSAVLQIMPHQEKELSDIRVPGWVEHWIEYKTFNDVTELNIDNDNKSFEFDNADYYDELERDEFFVNEDLSDEILVENACIHNLKNITVKIPKEKITVVTGISGSGKSSFAFDTLYHESQRQFMDLTTSNSFMTNDLKDSKVKRITGLQPSIAIEQKSLGLNPRSTVASVSKIGDYLRLLFATAGERICPNCNEIIPEDNVCKGCGAIYFTLTPAVFNYNHPEYMCPVCKGLGEELTIDIDSIVTNPDRSILDGASLWWGNLRKHREKTNANWMKGEVLALAADMNEDLEVPFKDLSESFKEQIFYGSKGRKVTLNYKNPNGRSGTITRPVEGVVNIIQRLLADNSGTKSLDYIERFVLNKRCHRCKGERLLEEGRMVRIGATRYPEATKMTITNLKSWCHHTYGILDVTQKEKCKAILKMIIGRLKKLEQVGLGYISLDRSIPTLSGGEAQRLKIARQFGSGLSNILYIMDEPSKGLHPKDFKFLIEAIQNLKKLKNTIVIVEHKKELIQTADYVIEIGPGAGQYGGQLLRAEAVDKDKQPTFDDYNYVIENNAVETNKKLILKGARTNNLKNVEVSLPLSSFICVIGVSGSGKSSLISKTLYPAIRNRLGKSVDILGEYDTIIGTEYISDIYYVSQKAIGKNSRSTPGTYTGAFDLIRELFADLSDAKKSKFTKEHFSSNSAKGQCEECKGAGESAIPMHFMPDIYITCNKCNGKRYKDSILNIKYKGYSISDLLDLEIGEVREIFKNEEEIFKILDMLCKVGLSYVKFGQSAASLSGGEAQRIKLGKELCNGKTKDTLYILDEPATGLHDNDIDKINYIIHELTQTGATVIAIEHNPMIIRQADYIIEMGPEGGEEGGYVLRQGWLRKNIV